MRKRPLLLFLFLFCLSWLSQTLLFPNQTKPEFTKRVLFEAVVEDFPQRLADAYRYSINVRGHFKDGQWEPFNVRMSVTHSDDEVPSKGDRVRIWVKPRRPRNLGNNGEFDVEAYYRLREIDYKASIHSPKQWAYMEKSNSYFNQWISKQRRRFWQNTDIFLSTKAKAWIFALVLGEKGMLEPIQKEELRRAGLLHLLVVSGFHLLLGAHAFWLGVRFLYRRSLFLIHRIPVWNLKAISMVLGAYLFKEIAHTDIPAQRAFALLGIYCTTQLFKHQLSALAALLAWMCLMCSWNAGYAFDLSFLLSCAAVIGIVVFTHNETNSGKKYIKLALGAFVFTTPILLVSFHRLSLWTPLSNIIFVLPFCLLIQLAWLTFFLPDSISQVVLCFCDEFIFYLSKAVSFVASLPGSHVFLDLKSCLAAIFAMFSINLTSPAPAVHFLSVGQGDAAIIQSQNKIMLLDTGTGPPGLDVGAQVVYPWLQYHGINKIDVLLITHADEDHLGGAQSLMELVPIRELWISKHDVTASVKQLKKQSQLKGIVWRSIHTTGPKLKWGPIQIQAFHPSGTLFEQKKNNSSLLLLLESSAGNMLFAGDIEQKVEQVLLRKNRLIQADILKLPHHGSHTSSSNNFLAKVKPKHAIASVGWNNRYKHPSQKVVKRLENAKIRLWRTDHCGQVTANSINNTWKLSSIKVCN